MNKEECRRTESLEVLFCFVIGNCCNVVVVRQEFRKKFLPKCVRWHALFLISRKDLVTLTCESSFLDIKNAPRGCALARSCDMSQATALGARMCFAHSLFFVINFVDNMDILNYAIYMEHELVSTIFLMTRRK